MWIGESGKPPEIWSEDLGLYLVNCIIVNNTIIAPALGKYILFLSYYLVQCCAFSFYLKEQNCYIYSFDA